MTDFRAKLKVAFSEKFCVTTREHHRDSTKNLVKIGFEMAAFSDTVVMLAAKAYRIRVDPVPCHDTVRHLAGPIPVTSIVTPRPRQPAPQTKPGTQVLEIEQQPNP